MDNSKFFSITRAILDSEIEPRYNHVHHARALHFLEECRVAYLEHIGCPLESYLSKRVFLVITRIDAQYKREIRSGTITVTCENPTINAKRVSLRQRIINDRGKDCIEALVEFAFLSGETGRSMVPPETFMQRFLNY